MAQAAGIIGSGSFGTAIARLIALNNDVLVYTRSADLATQINEERRHLGYEIADNITFTADPQYLTDKCQLLFPIIPSDVFREVIRNFSPFLKPKHFIIHGTKGFDVKDQPESKWVDGNIERKDICTMSQVIKEETDVLRIGCLSGPNLASEILEGQPTATLIASKYREVIKKGQLVLASKKFHVFGSYDMLGAELAGALKNAIALGSGMLTGAGLGKNIQAMLVTRGLVEMITLGKAMGTNSIAFLGTAGIGDLIATATSEKSRNFTFGKRMAELKDFDKVREEMAELAEGIRTIQIIKVLIKHYKVHCPIMDVIYDVLLKGADLEKSLSYLMRYPYDVDVDFL